MANALVDFWDGTFDYYTSAALQITGTDKRFVSALGIITTYHDDQRLKDAALLVDAAGMPTGAPTTPAAMPQLSGVFGSTNFPLGYIGTPILFTSALPYSTVPESKAAIVSRRIKMIR